MLELTDYRGDAEEAAAFAAHCWGASYAGKAYYPLWDADYMRHHLFDVAAGTQIGRIGAYLDGRLAGFLAAEVVRFRTAGGEMAGTMSSWLSVDPAEGGRGVGAALHRAMWDWQRARDCRFMIGFVDTGTLRGKGRGFWTRQVPDATVHRRPLLWTHVLDRHRAAAAEPLRIQAAAIPVLAAVQRSSRASREFIVRDYVDVDFPAVRTIFDAMQARADFGYIWSDARLRYQLANGPIARTLVLDRGGGAEAFASFSALTLMGRQALRCQVMDFAGATDTAEPLLPAFLRAAFHRLRAEDAGDAVLALGPPVHPAATLWAGGMLPLPPAQAMIHLPVAADARMPPVSRLLIHWR
jgi:GNAT superfamily N-acetyltransferase